MTKEQWVAIAALDRQITHIKSLMAEKERRGRVPHWEPETLAGLELAVKTLADLWQPEEAAS
jgi:hypothetical protein